MSRRSAVTVVATAVVVLLAGAAATVARRTADPVVAASPAGAARSLAAGGGFSDLMAPVTTLPAPTTVAPTTTTPTTPNTSTTRPAAAPAAGGTSSQPGRHDFGPRRPGSVSLPYSPGQTVWSATSNGMAMTLRMETANPAAGSPVRFVLEASPPAGVPCCFFQLSPSEDPGFSTQTSKTDPAGCAHPTTGPQRVEATLTFNHGGRYELLFQAASLCVNPDVSGVVYGFLDVGAGPSSPQGPSSPVLNADDGRTPAQAQDNTLAVAWAEARDSDGYIAGFSVDWGDGAVESFPGDPLGCRQGTNGWPSSSYTLISGSSRVPPPSHRYAVARPYVVTVSVWSTGCDGSDVQRVSSTFPWAPPAVPVPVTFPPPPPPLP